MRSLIFGSRNGGDSMAVPVAAIAKAAAALLSNEKTRKAVGWVIAAILSPVILIVVLVCSLLSGTADHNNSAVDLTFYGGTISSQMPADYRNYIEDMRGSFSDLDSAVSEIAPMIESGSIDSTRMKAIFYSLFFGAENLRMNQNDYRGFADAFVRYEERTRTVTDGDGNETEETYTVAIPLSDLNAIYGNLESTLGRTITEENRVNVQRIYSYAKYGKAIPGADAGEYPGEMGDGTFQALMEEATKYIGFPYVWGGSSPKTSFDCSGYVCWVYSQSGVYYLPRTTATGIFNQCAVISREEAQPGDLVFFQGTYASAGAISHVGIYVGNGQMLHCGSPIGYVDLNTRYWRSHFYAYGRLK